MSVSVSTKPVPVSCVQCVNVIWWTISDQGEHCLLSGRLVHLQGNSVVVLICGS